MDRDIENEEVDDITPIAIIRDPYIAIMGNRQSGLENLVEKEMDQPEIQFNINGKKFKTHSELSREIPGEGGDVKS